MECQGEAGSEGEVAADTLRANSNYASNEYFLPVMGIRRQRMVVIDTLERRVVASTETAYYYQPESLSAGLLVATKEPFHSAERVIWHVPEDLAGFKPSARPGRKPPNRTLACTSRRTDYLCVRWAASLVRR